MSILARSRILYSDFVFDLGKKIDIRDLDQSKEILLFSAQDLFSLEPNYRGTWLLIKCLSRAPLNFLDSEQNRIFPAITLNKSRFENPLDRERICLNLPGVDCYVSAQVSAAFKRYHYTLAA